MKGLQGASSFSCCEKLTTPATQPHRAALDPLGQAQGAVTVTMLFQLLLHKELASCPVGRRHVCPVPLTLVASPRLPQPHLWSPCQQLLETQQSKLALSSTSCTWCIGTDPVPLPHAGQWLLAKMEGI